MLKRIFAFLLCSVAIIITSGCALTTEQIDITYNQQPGVSKIPGASNVAVSVQVTDHRLDKSKVSSKKNGYGMEMAPITATEDVTITVKKAIEQELISRGFQLGSNTAIVNIATELSRFYNDHKVGFFSGDAVADSNMLVTVKSKRGGQFYSRQIVAQGVEPNTQLATGNNARLALCQALENCMKILFEDQAFISAIFSASK